MAQSEFAQEVTVQRLVAIWWAFAWRAMLLSAVLGALLGFIGGFVAALIGRRDLSAAVGALLGYLGSIPVSIVVLRHVLQKRFRTFEIRIVPLGN